jgi:hypothetical protein
MSYARERDEFIAHASSAGLRLDVIRLLLRNATTLQRLAEASCNGDWPADNGERKTKVCPECGGGWAPSSFARPKGEAVPVCPDCRAQYRVRALLEGTPFDPYFQGDPRGAVLRLVPKGTPHELIDCGRERGIYVPAYSR